MGLALQCFFSSCMAQCPAVTNMSVTLGANGTATVTPILTRNNKSCSNWILLGGNSKRNTNKRNVFNQMEHFGFQQMVHMLYLLLLLLTQ